MRVIGIGVAAAAALIASLPAQAATVCPGGGTCTGINDTLFGPSPSDIPMETNDQMIFLNAATTPVTSFTGQVGGQSGTPTVDFTTNNPVNVASGFATGISPPSATAPPVNTLDITIPGFQFTDFLFRDQLANTDNLNLTVEAFNGSTLLDTFETADLKHNADLDWKLLATNNNTITSVLLISSSPNSFEELKQFEVSGLSQTPIPAALPLFAGGLGILVMAGRRRKRKAQAVASGRLNIL